MLQHKIFRKACAYLPSVSTSLCVMRGNTNILAEASRPPSSICTSTLASMKNKRLKAFLDKEMYKIIHKKDVMEKT